MKLVLSATVAVLCASAIAPTLHGAALTDAVAWWQFEDNMANSINPTTSSLTSVLPSQGGMDSKSWVDSGEKLTYSAVSGLAATNAGSQAFIFDDKTVLKTNDSSLRIAGAQTLWIRVKFDTISASTVTLMSRHRASTGQRGIALQVTNGKVTALAASAPDSANNNAQTQVQAYSSAGYTLAANNWYDISMRFLPSTSTASGILRYDIYSPQTGALLSSFEITTNVPASLGASNSIGSGYFQIGSANDGSSGSAWLVPSGTQVEAAAVWNSYLSDLDLAKLSAIPEPASLGLLGIGAFGLLKRVR